VEYTQGKFMDYVDFHDLHRVLPLIKEKTVDISYFAINVGWMVINYSHQAA
jgi:hypothetical protein